MQIRDGAGNLLGVAGNPLVIGEDEGETFLGCYRSELLATIAAAAQTINTGGFFWGFNPAASGKLIRIERMGFQIAQTTSVAAGFPSAPRIGFFKFSYTGTPTGAAVAASGLASIQGGKFDTNHPAPVFDWRSAITGATCTYLHPLFSTVAAAIPIVGTVTTSQFAGFVTDNDYQPRESEYEHVIRPGEGIVLFQPEAGSTADTRRAVARIMWEEVTVP
jgi:hypothetical protein